MGHVVINNLCNFFLERRSAKRVINTDPDAHVGDRLLVLEDVNLEILDGELLCILGPSGCGKSTLARIIAGFDRPS